MHRRYSDSWRVVFFLLYLGHTLCLPHVWDVKPYTSPRPHASTLRRVLGFYQRSPSSILDVGMLTDLRKLAVTQTSVQPLPVNVGVKNIRNKMRHVYNPQILNVPRVLMCVCVCARARTCGMLILVL